MATSSAAILLGRQFKQMQTDKDIPGISCGLVGSNIFDWEVMLMLDDENGGLFGLCSPILEANETITRAGRIRPSWTTMTGSYISYRLKDSHACVLATSCQVSRPSGL